MRVGGLEGARSFPDKEEVPGSSPGSPTLDFPAKRALFVWRDGCREVLSIPRGCIRGARATSSLHVWCPRHPPVGRRSVGGDPSAALGARAAVTPPRTARRDPANPRRRSCALPARRRSLVQSGQVRVAARKEVSASMIPKQQAARPAMQASAATHRACRSSRPAALRSIAAASASS